MALTTGEVLRWSTEKFPYSYRYQKLIFEKGYNYTQRLLVNFTLKLWFGLVIKVINNLIFDYYYQVKSTRFIQYIIYIQSIICICVVLLV